MTLRSTLALALLTAAVVSPTVLAQPPGGLPGPPPAPLPSTVPSPLLFVRLAGPAGSRASFFQGRAPARSFPAPVVVGVRPGYCYRVRIDDLPGLNGVTLFPSIEVRGSLHLGPRVSAATYPVPVTFSQADIESALTGNLITRVYYLEHPDKAEPVASVRTEALESEVPPDRDLLAEARDRGRVMLVVRLGARVPLPEELLAQAVPGTLLFPGDRAMLPAQGPPCLPVGPWPWFDPRLGPKPAEEECLHDGGDRRYRAAIGPGGRLAGLDPEDTVAEYTDARGRRSVTCSNRVCLCVPRYLCLRSELPLGRHDSVVSLLDGRGVTSQVQVARKTGPDLARAAEILQGMTGRSRPGVNVSTAGPGVLVCMKVLQAHHLDLGLAEMLGTVEVRRLTELQRAQLRRQVEFAREMSGALRTSEDRQVTVTAVVGRVEAGAEILTSTVETRDLTVCCNECPLPPDRPLCLVKCADRTSAEVGDVITFTLKYSNQGGRPITDVAVSDSLSGRLEYVPGSAESDRETVFTMQENEAGSLVLRWEVAGKLLPGQSGRLKFKARVR